MDAILVSNHCLVRNIHHSYVLTNAQSRRYLLDLDVYPCVMDESIRVELDVAFLEDDVEKVLMHLLNGKSQGWDGLTN